MSEQVSANVDVKPEQPAPEKKKAKKSWLRKINPLLWVTVIVPTLCSGVYYGLFASDQFTSQSSFVVRSPKSQSSLNGLGAILQGSGFSRSQDDIYTVQEYMQSRSALDALRKKMPVRDFYEKKAIFSAVLMVLACVARMRHFINITAIRYPSILTLSQAFPI